MAFSDTISSGKAAVARIMDATIAASQRTPQAMRRLTSYLWPPRLLRRPPTDSFQQMAKLHGRDRHHPIGRRRPQKAFAFEPLGNRQAPWPSCQMILIRSPRAAEHKQMPAMRIALQRLLHKQRQPGKPRRISVRPVANQTLTPQLLNLSA